MVTLGLRLPRPGEVGRERSVEYASLAVEAGVDTVWVSEGTGQDSVVLLAQLVERFDSVEFGSAIFDVFSRSPAQLAMAAAGLDDVSGGRFRLGVGVSGPARIEGFHGVPYERPLRRQREYIEIVKAYLAGETVDYDGECVTVSGFALSGIDEPVEVPIYVAAMGETNLRLTGEFADGWLPHLIPPAAFEESLAAIREGLDRADRPSDAVSTEPFVLTCASERAPAAARDAVRSLMAFYIGAMGDYYYETVRQYGYPEVADAVRNEWTDGHHDRARATITDDVLAKFTASGTPSEAVETFERFGEAGADATVAYAPPRASDRLIRETIQNL